MTQAEVLSLLKKRRRWMTAKEINKHFNFTSAQANLLRLYLQGLVIRKEELVDNTQKKCFIFKAK